MVAVQALVVAGKRAYPSFLPHDYAGRCPAFVLLTPDTGVSDCFCTCVPGHYNGVTFVWRPAEALNQGLFRLKLDNPA